MANHKKNKKLAETLRSNRAVMGFQRKRHFENGGDLASWRGRSNVFVDKKKQRDKRKCRNKIHPSGE